MLPIFKHTPLGGWTPLNEDGVDGGVIRLYRSDRGVTAIGSESRARVGTIGASFIPSTELVEEINSTDTSMEVDSTATFRQTTDYAVRIDDEYVKVTGVAGEVLTIERHYEGTTEATHLQGAKVRLAPPDGQAFVELPSGRLLLLGGALMGHASGPNMRINNIWYSDDRGRTWDLLLGDTAGTSTRPERGHNFGCFTATFGGTPYVYWIGGDPFDETGRVYRIEAADLDVGGTYGGWEWVNENGDSCPTDNLALYMYGVLGGNIYVIGGQVDINGGASSTGVYVSTDEGVSWDPVLDENDDPVVCPANVKGGQCGPLPVKDGKLWICGSSRYEENVHDFTNAVYTFDGTEFDPVLTDSHGEFPKHRYHSCVVDGTGRLWLFNGSTYDGMTMLGDTKSIHSSTNGVDWDAWDPAKLPWSETHAQAAIATSEGVFLTHGFQGYRVFALRVETGDRVSEWRDQRPNATSATHLKQSTNAAKPLLVPKMFGGKPGIVAHGAQIMVLDEAYTAADDGITDPGGFEAWAIVRSLTFDDDATMSCIVVGNTTGSAYNNLCLFGGKLRFHYADQTGYFESNDDLFLNDDRPHLVGVQFYPEDLPENRVKLFVDGVAVPSTQYGADPTFSEDYTGWNAIFGGSLGGEDEGTAEAALGAVVIRKGATTAWGEDVIARMMSWARDWRVAS